MLYETFWAAFARDWYTPLRALRSLWAGRAALKAELARRVQIDPALLPYNEPVLQRLRDWRAAGGRSALVTASDQGIADAIADHLGLFDEVYGSDGRRNLKGAKKAAFLRERYADTGFSYIGDSRADLAVWPDAHEKITFGADSGLRAAAERCGEGRTTYLSPQDKVDIGAYVKALRPHQWLKNLLVFVPMLTAHDLTWRAFGISLIAFIAFSMIASSVYVLNDLLDLSADRTHPRKRLRPFASGRLRVQNGGWMAPGLLLGGMLLALLVGLPFLGVICSYYVVTLLYSLNLKRRLVIDICTLAGLYTLRIVAGGTATGLPLSVWLLAFSIFFFFALAAVKRQAELVDGVRAGKIKAHGRGYHVEDLPLIGTMATASGYVAVLVMALYVNSPDISARYSEPALLWGICLVLLYWISRIVMITHRGMMHDDPVVYAARDRNSQICAVLIFGLATMGAML